MPPSSALQTTIAPPRSATPQQKRFNTLLRQIAQARAGLAMWRQSVGAYRQAYAKEVLPLQDSLAVARRARAFALDTLHDQAQWTGAENAALSELVRLAARDLLERDGGDAALRALFAKHGDADFDAERQRELLLSAELMQLATGLDPDDLAGIETDEDLLERLHRKGDEGHDKAQAERTAREADAERRRQSFAGERHEATDERAMQSLRELFRKLASALHPDRESDPERRQAKTALMQQANQAYAEGDLLTLLQLQLQVEQVNFGRIADAGAEQLGYYIKVLSAQLLELKQEMRRVETEFCLDFGLPPDLRVSAGKLGALIRQDKQVLHDHLARLGEEMHVLSDHAAARRWLKRRRRMRGEFESGPRFG